MDKFERHDAQLCAMAARDKQMVLAWRNQDRVRQHMYTTHVISETEHDTWFGNVLVRQDQKHFIFGFRDRPVGVVSFTDIDQHSQTASWAFYLGETDVPKGTGSLMEYVALEYAFDDLELFKLSCEVLATNPGVVKMHLRFGFHEEGLFKSHRLREQNRVDVHRLALLRDEWSVHRGNISALLFGSRASE